MPMKDIISSYLKHLNPSLKKRIKDNEKLLTSYDHKKSEYQKSIRNMNESLEQFCKDLHIENMNDCHELTIYNEIKRSVKEIPKYMSNITELLNDKKLIEACEYYAKFINYIEGIDNNNNNNEDENGSENNIKKGEDLLSSIYHFITLPKDYSCIQIPADNVTIPLSNNSDNENEEISWDIDIETAQVQESTNNNGNNNNDDDGEINWDLDDDDLLMNTDGENNNNNNNGIISESNGNEGDNSEWAINVEESGDISVETCGTMLLNQESRGRIIQNLSELNSFYKQRKNEINNISVSLMSTQLFPSELKSLTLKEISNYQTLISEILNELRDERFNQLLMIYNSNDYVDRLCERVKGKLRCINKLNNNIIQIEKEKENILEMNSENIPKLEEIKVNIKEYIKIVENKMSELLKNIEVHIVGAIKSL